MTMTHDVISCLQLLNQTIKTSMSKEDKILIESLYETKWLWYAQTS